MLYSKISVLLKFPHTKEVKIEYVIRGKIKVKVWEQENEESVNKTVELEQRRKCE